MRSQALRSGQPPGRREGPDTATGPTPDHADTRPLASVRPGTAAAAELAAWAAAVIHLHRAGLPAAVPEFPAAWLRRRGARPDWVAAA
jgi:hypothetical protein